MPICIASLSKRISRRELPATTLDAGSTLARKVPPQTDSKQIGLQLAEDFPGARAIG